jgi:hypothetical protein
VQTLEYSICAFVLWFVGHNAALRALVEGDTKEGLHAPQPTQDIHGENGNARSGGNASQRLFGARFTVCKTVAADDDCNETCNLRNRAGKEVLDGVKAGVERAALGIS